MKKTWSLLAFLTLTLLLSAWSAKSNPEVHSLPLSRTSSSQAHKRNPVKQLDSSFRRIPPSTPNPTQNQFNPPTDG
ncbi:uncharacterized protein LOC129298103 [Prosopis cineraria]|uniref:uncharacterized protein LOC129298103 n=1 Tax=Prosopis cineraria TaxID=364024 RepID=UPI0024107346|nr:uncharacterized protein LOC129298103 [Prosopis cineraria]